MSDEHGEILLIEDNPKDIQLIRRCLERSGITSRVHVARDGQEALDFLFCRGPHSGRSFDSPPPFVILDLKLPRLDGMEILRQVKSDPRTRLTPIVVFTGSKEPRDVQLSYQLGVNSYVQKPINFDEFQQAVKQLGAYWVTINVGINPTELSPP